MNCPNCRAMLAEEGAARCPACGGVLKGPFLTKLRPGFGSFARYWVFLLGGAGATSLLLTIAIAIGWMEVAIQLGGILLFGVLALANWLFLLSVPVRVHQNGLEMDIPRSLDRSVYLPWEHMVECRIDGDTLHYRWQENGLIVLRAGTLPAAWPVLHFPRSLAIPDARTRALLLVVLNRVATPSPGGPGASTEPSAML
jgi:hypothetical protein